MKNVVTLWRYFFLSTEEKKENTSFILLSTHLGDSGGLPAPSTLAGIYPTTHIMVNYKVAWILRGEEEKLSCSFFIYFRHLFLSLSRIICLRMNFQGPVPSVFPPLLPLLGDVWPPFNSPAGAAAGRDTGTRREHGGSRRGNCE